MAFPDDREDSTESAPRRFLRKKRADDAESASPRRSRKGRKEAADTGDTFGMTDPFGAAPDPFGADPSGPFGGGPSGSFGGGPAGPGGSGFFGSDAAHDPFDTAASGPGGPGSGRGGPGGPGRGAPGPGGPGPGGAGPGGPGGPGPSRREPFAPGGPQRDPFDVGAPGSGPALRGLFDAGSPGAGPAQHDPFDASAQGPSGAGPSGPGARGPFGAGPSAPGPGGPGARGSDPAGPGARGSDPAGPGVRGSDGPGTRGRDPFESGASGAGPTDPGTRGRDPFDAATSGSPPSRRGSRRRAPFGGDSDELAIPGAEGGHHSGAADGKEATDDTKTAQRRDTWSPYAEGPRSRGPLYAVLGGVAVLGLLVAALVVMFKSGDDATTAAQTTRRTSAPLPSGPAGKYAYAGSRKTDPEPLTVKELFPGKKVTVSGRSYQLTITSKLKKCADGAMGAKMQKALKDGKCTQLIRASFRDKAGKVIGTVGVANLSTSKAATKVTSVGSDANYVKPLPGKDEVTKLVGSGSGGANVWMHGHYAVMIWFQNKDGSKPDKKSQKAIMRAVDDITKATVFKALDARSLTGHPGS
ncbi:hypothetical protein ACWGH8_41000 [Nonomuraea muscovyensis]|uniref:Uncharacterized protein n=1 Tax=Nonomuraea muscovyensis TaxID=1124761 RepID=A0A7X0CB17_9ACTN|nr:hypothetical protein [Nonomuraea muscovyensis]MBB6350426.1 hypothetical protein [Nonomuraea muscovyensis]